MTKQYRVVNRNIKGGWFTNAEDRVEKQIQPLLDEHAKAGWKLHTFTATEASKGINLVIVWEAEA
jgi:hypothetical protein